MLLSCRAAWQAIMSRVADQTPDQLGLLIEDELRVITECPYEYEEDDEVRCCKESQRGGGGSSNSGLTAGCVMEPKQQPSLTCDISTTTPCACAGAIQVSAAIRGARLHLWRCACAASARA